MSVLRKTDSIVLRIQATIVVLANLFVLFGVSAIAFQRYVFGGSLYGMDELIVIAAFWMYFIGAAYATRYHRHISADIISVYLRGRRIGDLVQLLSSVITLGLSGLFTYWAWEMFSWSLAKGGETPVFGIPNLVLHTSILLGFIFMTLYFAVELIGKLTELRQTGHIEPQILKEQAAAAAQSSEEGRL
ncbi:TRAP transporter small permease [Fodinicurvata halophila]|uniref:TRAP transporter small permease protein n=1 Tax=Fodinicurvata halophila TaxID=1419723 RepID=A0ABV8UHI8_9PROT